jgi:hypothetical protein
MQIPPLSCGTTKKSQRAKRATVLCVAPLGIGSVAFFVLLAGTAEAGIVAADLISGAALGGGCGADGASGHTGGG